MSFACNSGSRPGMPTSWEQRTSASFFHECSLVCSLSHRETTSVMQSWTAVTLPRCVCWITSSSGFLSPSPSPMSLHLVCTLTPTNSIRTARSGSGSPAKSNGEMERINNYVAPSHVVGKSSVPSGVTNVPGG